MYRITNINTTLSTILESPLSYVRMGENGWEFIPDKDENGNPVDPALEAEYISVPDWYGEDQWGICRLANTLPEDEESEYPVVMIVQDNGLAVAELKSTAKDHTTQIEETGEAIVELAEVNDTVANELYEGLTESTEVVLGMIADLAARVEELEGKVNQ